MKKYDVVVEESDNSASMSAFDLFVLSDHVSEEWTRKSLEFLNKNESFDTKLKAILREKRKEQRIYASEEFQEVITSLFFVDGAVRLSQADMDELEKSMVLISREPNGKETLVKESKEFLSYKALLLRDFLYKRGGEYIFRNPKYYFLLDGLDVDIGSKTTSINDYRIRNVDVGEFAPELAAHYNSAHQHLKLFSSFYFGHLYASLAKSKEEFCAELESALSPEKISKLRSVVASGQLHTGSPEFDVLYLEQWRNTLGSLERLRELAVQFRSDPTTEIFQRIVQLLSRETIAIEHAKIECGIGIDEIFNRYFKERPPQAVKKMLLGLLDAKINILAFNQNVAHIFTSDQFLNADYTGSLVFTQSQVRHIRSVCPNEFNELKKLQQDLLDDDLNIRLLRELDETVGFYTDALLDDNGIGIVKLLGGIDPDLPELADEPHYSVPLDISGSLSALVVLFQTIDRYVSICGDLQENRLRKKAAGGKPYKKSDAHLSAKHAALNRIIRLYREENDPLVMIKTAQNAINFLYHKGLVVTKDVLHIMSVNYGGCLVGSFAKHMFIKTVKHGQILTNPGNVIYSIYDVKNANQFSRLIDYPFARVIRNTQTPSDVKARFSQRNWMLVFDDNTNSGQTLDDIRLLADASGFYGRVDLFPCRASTEFRNYRKTMPDEFILNMLICCGALARKSRITSERNRYKETIGSIVGNRIYKIYQAKNMTSDH
ncbi:MAG: hypothetical protein AB1437_22190 [Pseudomonadota bacterium]